jgi:hypothetical protein
MTGHDGAAAAATKRRTSCVMAACLPACLLAGSLGSNVECVDCVGVCERVLCVRARVGRAVVLGLLPGHVGCDAFQWASTHVSAPARQVGTRLLSVCAWGDCWRAGGSALDTQPCVACVRACARASKQATVPSASCMHCQQRLFCDALAGPCSCSVAAARCCRQLNDVYLSFSIINHYCIRAGTDQLAGVCVERGAVHNGSRPPNAAPARCVDTSHRHLGRTRLMTRRNYWLQQHHAAMLTAALAVKCVSFQDLHTHARAHRALLYTRAQHVVVAF